MKKLSPDQLQELFQRALKARNSGHLQECDRICLEITKTDPKNINALNILSVTACESGKYESAVDYLTKSICSDPEQFLVYNSLADCYKKLGDYKEAELCFKKSIILNSSCLETFHNYGTLLYEIDKIDEAIINYRIAINIDSSHAVSLCNLGQALNVQGNSNEAIPVLRKAVKQRPSYGLAHKSLAAILNFKEYGDDIKLMESAYNLSNLQDDDKRNLSFALGKVWEDLGDYKKSLAYYKAGNFIRRRKINYSSKSQADKFNALKIIFNKQLFQRNIDNGARSKLPIFIVGMPRSGTTLIEQILSSHPDVYGAGELTVIQELSQKSNFSVETTNNLTKVELGELGHKYLSSMKSIIRDIDKTYKHVTDKMPENFLMIGFIKLVLPHAKIIHCMRSPQDTCLSIFKNDFSKMAHLYAYEQTELGLYYNQYKDLMSHWHKIFPNEIYDIQYENVVTDLETQSRALVEYCGLEWNNACLGFHKNKRNVLTASSMQVRRPIYTESVQKWKKYEEFIQPLLEALDEYNPQ